MAPRAAQTGVVEAFRLGRAASGVQGLGQGQFGQRRAALFAVPKEETAGALEQGQGLPRVPGL